MGSDRLKELAKSLPNALQLESMGQVSYLKIRFVKGKNSKKELSLVVVRARDIWRII